jgi:uncharacterized membrane protein YhaH (DUF805 family)
VVHLLLLIIAQRSVVFVIFIFSLIVFFFIILMAIVLVVIILSRMFRFLSVISRRYRDQDLNGILLLRNVPRRVEQRLLLR